MTERKSALVLSGGGARGAYQVGVIKALASLTKPGTQPFPILTGVSVGALNACVLAADGDDFPRAAAELEKIWRALSCDAVYRTDWRAMSGNILGWLRAAVFGWAGARPPRSLLDNAPLRDLLDTHIDFARLNSTVGEGALKAFAITSSSYATGRAITFFKSERDIEQWQRARREGVRSNFSPDHVLGSSALPFVFPAIEHGGIYYGDGALRENAPLSAAIHLGCDRIFTIGARDLEPDPEKPQAHPVYPSVGYLAGQMLDILFNDNADADIERLKRINSTLALLTDEQRQNSHLRPIEIFAINPSTDIREIAGRHSHELPASVKAILRVIGAMSEPWVLPSYLTFEPGYIGELIDLGYADTMAQKAQWQAMLGI
ncbi:patatin-like phospholipase family protein [Parvularcula sp. LCG005]|uniref:patatin-like phospholipase family protein n=1 Tax=Parvularcula sp. LCG005 TaxID=3078805 RepID=UPI002942EFDF|nr:patatin-like phospholipase family protein [Parvularcula sp. LCG005]WOI52349.1 patatin-like phospholipase family protein [Parvularcula sp. LCG005]